MSTFYFVRQFFHRIILVSDYEVPVSRYKCLLSMLVFLLLSFYSSTPKWVKGTDAGDQVETGRRSVDDVCHDEILYFLAETYSPALCFVLVW